MQVDQHLKSASLIRDQVPTTGVHRSDSTVRAKVCSLPPERVPFISVILKWQTKQPGHWLTAQVNEMQPGSWGERWPDL